MIPLQRFVRAGREIEYVQQVLSGPAPGSGGPFTERCERALSDHHDGHPVMLTTSCTAALELAALLTGVGPGDEVIVPTFTFVSTANAFALRGAAIVFADSRPDTLNVDESLVDCLVTPRSRVVVPVHYAGIACDMDALAGLAARHGLTVVEDNAHGLFGSWRGRALGTFGQLAACSFHETKNLSCGEGGALVINDERYRRRAEVLCEKGTDRRRFLRGEVASYEWVDLGSSFAPAEVLAAVLCAQLEEGPAIQGRRALAWRRYVDALSDWVADSGASLPTVPANCGPAWHVFYLLLPDRAAREALMAHLRRAGVGASFHFLPLHLSPMGRRLGGREGQCPVAEDLAGRLVRLPLYAGLSVADQDTVIEAVRRFRC
jgi:dTDP-4-amino-4,6-dideoxygalactose transaminase